MHELSLTQAVVEAITERVGDARITSVRLEIGRLSGVVVDSIRFCFDLVAEGTTLHGARLDIDQPGGQAHCRSCATEFTVDDPIVLCPSCDSANVAVLSGHDLRIISVEVDTACAEPAAARTTPSSS